MLENKIIHIDDTNRFGLSHDGIIGLTAFDPSNITSSLKDGYGKCSEKIKQILDDYSLEIYFIPSITIGTLYNDFVECAYSFSCKNILNSIFNIHGKQRSINELLGRTIVYKNIKYNPPEELHDFGYYLSIEMDTDENIGNGEKFQTLMLYELYCWYNQFRKSGNNHWSRPPTLFLKSDNTWRLHPGRARMQFPQFSNTTTSLFMVKDKNVKFTMSDEYLKDTILVQDFNQVKDILSEKSGYDNSSFSIQEKDGIVDIFYNRLDHDGSEFNGEKWETFYGDKLIISFNNNILSYNNEPIIEIKDDMCYFINTDTPQFRI